MNIMDFFRPRDTGAAILPGAGDGTPTVQELMVSRPLAPAPAFMTKGMWVATSEGIGIATAFFESGEVEVHLTDAIGLTIASVTLPAGKILGQARYDDIPAPRRPAREVAATLGYI